MIEYGSPKSMSAMSERFKVRVTKDHLVFSAGHFISYEGHKCERLHGHNFRVAIEVQGTLDENHCVIDFAVLKDYAKAITGELDHRMLLPTKNNAIKLEVSEKRVEVFYRDRQWSFPRGDTLLLPIENTTAELLARYVAYRLKDDLEKNLQFVPTVLRVEVEENTGQSATCEIS